MQIRKQIQEATKRQEALLLTGVTMGGGPSQWAAQAHVRAGHRLFATAEAAQTFNDDLIWVRNEMGVEVVSEDEAARLKGVREIELRDFDYATITTTLRTFGVDLDPQAVAVAVFDHGAAPPDVSDRQFRFDYLRARIEAENRLSAFAFLADQIPPSMTRMKAVTKNVPGLDCPLLVMDTAPAAVLGTLLDPKVTLRSRVVITNVGNFHTLAFRLGPSGIEGVFEHHTGEIDLARLETLLEALADGSLSHKDVFDDQGHGALILHPEPLPLTGSEFGVAVTGPRRSMMRDSRLRPYFAVPFGDMMLTGCFGLLVAVADHIPTLSPAIQAALSGVGGDTTPWDAGV